MNRDSGIWGAYQAKLSIINVRRKRVGLGPKYMRMYEIIVFSNLMKKILIWRLREIREIQAKKSFPWNIASSGPWLHRIFLRDNEKIRNIHAFSCWPMTSVNSQHSLFLSIFIRFIISLVPNMWGLENQVKIIWNEKSRSRKDPPCSIIPNTTHFTLICIVQRVN